MEIIKVTPRGYCKGVTRAISLAKKTALENPNRNIYVLGMLVHNRYVMQALNELHIIAVDDKRKTRLELLDEIPMGSIVIFTAHGIAPNVVEKAKSLGLECVDASCLDVVKTQDIVKERLEEGYDILYIGKE
ncbi:MAG: 4-hydroxy-3-methylbut-2-enyl diphosphate reductase, partial [Longicatena sp.]